MNCFRVRTNPSEDHVTRGTIRATLIKLNVKEKERKERGKRRETEEIEEKGERGREKKDPISLYDLQRSGDCLLTV